MDEKLLRNVAIGVAAAAVALLMAPGLAGAARPLVRKGVKSAVTAFVRSRETFAELQELAEDAYAEAIAELEQEAAAAAAAAAAATASAAEPAARAAAPRRKSPTRKAGVRRGASKARA